MSDIRYLSVTELNQLVNETFKSHLPQVHFEGEISQLTVAASGHMYFTIKDAKSQIASVMWRGSVASLSFRPEPGLAVLCHGKPNVYHASGKLQVVVHKLLPAGEGLLQKKYLELKAKLEREGLFDESRKRELPFLPRAVGVVTSGTGAVIHDIMTKIHERMPNMQVYLMDVRVQGEGAAQEIATAIHKFQELGLVDVLIIGRGGGSLEDLWAFNEEVVARAVFASRIPIVSGVGHEVDFALSDFVADRRAPTPTAAAEMVVPKREDLLQAIHDLELRLGDLEEWFLPLAQQVDELEARLSELVYRRVSDASLKLKAAEASLRSIRPAHQLKLAVERLDTLSGRLRTQVHFRFSRSDELVNGLALRLESISPRRVLERGFSLVQRGKKVVRSSEELSLGDKLSISFATGTAEADVVDLNKE